MAEINVYFDTLDLETIEVAKKLRSWETDKVHVWFSRKDFDSCPDNEVRRQIGCARSRQFIEDRAGVDKQVEYWEWNRVSEQLATNLPVESGLAALIHRVRNQDMLFVGFGGKKRKLGRIHAFVDAMQSATRPEEWISCAWFSDYEDLRDFCREKGAYAFDLNNTAVFQKTGRFYDGKPVYREKDTGRYVYLDNLHRNHYEVFGWDTRHLGEMSLTGELDRSKADPSKHYP